MGPPGIAATDAPISFTASVRGNIDASLLEFRWRISSGDIKIGQGTPTVTVDPKDRPLRATVEVMGFPEGCPAVASEYYGGDPPPSAVMFHQWKEGESADDQTKDLLLTTFRDYPTDQIYVLSAEVPGSANKWLDSQEIFIRATLIRNQIALDRVTMVRIKNKSAFVQLWRVPPGANNPRCDECEKWLASIRDCPTITVNGPAGVVQPGENMTFVGELIGSVPSRLTYRWEINDSDVIEGQGTLVLKARFMRTAWGGNVIATLNVSGLPRACPSSSSYVHPVTIHPEPEELGNTTNGDYLIGSTLLNQIKLKLIENPNSQLYVWVYVGSSITKVQKVRASLLRQLSTTKIDPARFRIVASDEYDNKAVFWIVPPGADNPAP